MLLLVFVVVDAAAGFCDVAGDVLLSLALFGSLGYAVITGYIICYCVDGVLLTNGWFVVL